MVKGIDALARAIRIIGTQTRAAAVIGIRQQSISEILRRGKRVPAEWCIPLERATAEAGERITSHQLRPDLYPDARKPNGRRTSRRTAVDARP